ncbi:MAG TPA: N-acetylmuramoyl-L-alanine amidase CwlD [Ruminiclostridium sp.]|nr:N-acetylmuramoyl-L-alanine amidase CwlD [Ruminiclostridium sp.]
MKIRIVKTPIKLARFKAVLFIALCSVFLVITAFFSIKHIQNVLAANYNSKDKEKIIIIDPGHGGVDGGAVGYNNIVEKNINLAISLKLRSLFEASGYKVVMTREDDRSIHDEGSDTIREKKVTDIHNRSAILEKYPSAIFISIHQNKFEQSQYSGTQVFYSKNNDDGKLLASLIQNSAKEQLQPENDRVIKPAGKDLYILYHAKLPAVMVECGFLSNPREATLLNTDEYQSKMAFSIYCGTLDYYT